MSSVFRWLPGLFLAVIVLGFGTLSPTFLSPENLGAILTQSGWLIAAALGMNLVLLTSGVDLSVGSTMYLAAVTVALGLHTMPLWICLTGALAVGAGFGALNGLIIVELQLPPFIVTLATLFVGRGLGLYLSSTQIVFASLAVADLGRSKLASVPTAMWLAGAAMSVSGLILRRTPLGPYIRSIGADREAARRVGVPVEPVTRMAYCLCGALAGLAGFISLSQTASASAAFAQNAEFLAIAAAVLGGTSLFGGRGTLWAPLIGAVLITTVQNGLAMINANPYAYPVITGAVIFLAALLDSLRSGLFRTRRVTQ